MEEPWNTISWEPFLLLPVRELKLAGAFHHMASSEGEPSKSPKPLLSMAIILCGVCYRA
jgi:hypothetical protein